MMQRVYVLLWVMLTACFPPAEAESPRLYSITPEFGTVGTLVTLKGTHLKNQGESTLVLLGNDLIKPESVTEESVTFVVPEGARRDFIAVRVGDRWAGAIDMKFTVVNYDTGPWLQVTTGGQHTCGIKPDHSLWCWGGNFWGQLGQGNNNAELLPVNIPGAWDSVSVPDYVLLGNSCGIKSDNSAWCWGDNSSGPLEENIGSPVTFPARLVGEWDDISLGGWLACGTQSDGLYCWSRAFTEPSLAYLAQPQPYGSWTTVAVGYTHACGIRADHTLWCWGANESGQLGNGNVVPSLIPVAVQIGFADWVTVSAGGGVKSQTNSHVRQEILEGQTCAIRASGALWCWGSNEEGQLAYTEDGAYAFPLAVKPETRWKDIDTGSMRTCGISVKGELWCWGVGSSTPKIENQVYDWKTVSVSQSNTCGLTANGTGICLTDFPNGITTFVVP